MRPVQPIIIALLTSAFGLMPMNAIAQDKPNGFLILSNPGPLAPRIRVVNCPEDQSGTIKCTVYNVAPCGTKKESGIPLCEFPLKQPINPSVAVYGVSGANTCTWVVFDGKLYKFGQC